MGMDLRRVIDDYHALLTPEIAAASQGQLDDQQQARGLAFGTRPICTVLRPRFLTVDQYAYLRARVKPILNAFDRAYRIAMAEPEFRAQFMLTPTEEELIQGPFGFQDPSPTSRLDTFFIPGTGELKVVEYNAEVPAAIAYNHEVSEIFMTLPVMRGFLKRYSVRSLSSRHLLLNVLLDAFQQWSGRREKPSIAILDWEEVPTYSEFVLFRDYFQEQGISCVIADPRQMEYRNGVLSAGGTPVNLIYKRVLISELLERTRFDQPVLRAVRDGAACMINPFACKLLHKKASLAVLSDERNRHLFSAAEQEAIAAHIPWTRRVADERTTYHGEPIDLVQFMLDNRQRLVLKANDEYGGKGVVLGWDIDDAGWEWAITVALSEPSVVQERVTVDSEPFPRYQDGQLHIVDSMLDTDPFVYHGAFMEGALTRISTAALLNVTAGGGSTVATMVVEER